MITLSSKSFKLFVIPVESLMMQSRNIQIDLIDANGADGKSLIEINIMIGDFEVLLLGNGEEIHEIKNVRVEEDIDCQHKLSLIVVHFKCICTDEKEECDHYH